MTRARAAVRAAGLRAFSRFGVHGLILLNLAYVDVCMAAYLSAWFTSPNPNAANVIWRDQYAPDNAWAGLWLVVAVCAAVGAFLRNDWVGYAPAAAIKFLWASLEFGGWVRGEIPNGWLLGAVWIGFGILILGVAVLEEPRHLFWEDNTDGPV